jgi:hypothetical protein
MSYKVLYHEGDEVSFRTKAKVGRLSLDDATVSIVGEKDISIPFKSLRSSNLFRLHGTGRMLKIVHENGVLFVSVIRFCLLGFFASVNFFATGRLQKELEGVIQGKTRY